MARTGHLEHGSMSRDARLCWLSASHRTPQCTGRSSFRIAFSFVVILFAFFLVVLLLFVIFFFGDFSKQAVGSDHTITRNRKMYSAHAQWYARSMKRYSALIRQQ